MPSPLFQGMGEIFMGALKEAVNATFTPMTGPVIEDVPIIFNARFVDVDVSGVAFGAPRPVAWFLTGAIDPQPKHGDSIEINSITYKVRSVEPDGHEMTKLELSV